MPTAAALLSIVVTVAMFVILTGATTFSVLVGALLAAGGVGMGIKGWNDAAMPKTFSGWLRTAAVYLSGGAVIYTVECIFGRLVHPELGFFQAGLRTGPFGGIFTFFVTGSLVLFAIGGAAYRGAEKRMKSKVEESR
jgi:hypothetical protein